MNELTGIEIGPAQDDPANIKAYLQYKDHLGKQYVLPMTVEFLAELIEYAHQARSGLPRT